MVKCVRAVFLAAAASFILCSLAVAHPFECMANTYESDHTIMAWEEYKDCMRDNFSYREELSREEYEGQAAEYRKMKLDSLAYEKLPFGTLPPEIRAIDTSNFQGNFEWDYIREAIVNIKRYMADLDAGYVVRNKVTNPLFIKKMIIIMNI